MLLRFCIARATLALVMVLLAAPAMAAPQDYMFELAQLEVRTGDATLVVRLIQMSGEKPVLDAVIVENRVEMMMPGRAPIAVTATPAHGDGSGNYRFEATLPLRGDWVVHLAAKVPGEAETVRGEIKVMAMP